ncbi:MAG: hypothetical protein QMD09_14690 [Desulfatibacillaceae bacterium]|nr:hypothetical protein [Desulfatibacillaceae bacterium]
MHLIVCVIKDESLLFEILTGWIDAGITGGTIVESTGALELLSDHVPIFAGFRSLVSGGNAYSKTLFTAVNDPAVLEAAIGWLKKVCQKAGPDQGVYFVAPLSDMGHLGQDCQE